MAIRCRNWSRVFLGYLVRNAASLAVCLIAISCSLAQPASTRNPRSQPQSRQRSNQRLVFDETKVRPNEVLVRFANTLNIQSIQRIIKTLPNVDVVEKIGGVPNLYRIHSRNRSVKELLDRLRKYLNREVLYAEPNVIVRAESDPNDLGFENQWGLKNTGLNLPQVHGTAGQDVSAIPAWELFGNMQIGSRAIVTGVIDSGIDYNHRDLMNNIWSAPSTYKVTVGGLDIECEQGTHGYDFVNHDCFPMDDNNHGTRQAGITGAEGNNAFGMAGVNWVASMLAIKILDNDAVGDAAMAANAVEFAIQLKRFFKENDFCDVRILNNSYGWYLHDCSSCQSVKDQIEIARDNGILFVASAGNDGIPTDIGQNQHFPSGFNISNIISVAAFDNNGLFATFSNFGATSVHLAAPGQEIYSTIRNNGFSFRSGTSEAAAFVSGAAALALARCPTLSTAGLKAAILNNVDPVTSWSTTPISTSGRLNIYQTSKSCTP